MGARNGPFRLVVADRQPAPPQGHPAVVARQPNRPATQSAVRGSWGTLNMASVGPCSTMYPGNRSPGRRRVRHQRGGVQRLFRCRAVSPKGSSTATQFCTPLHATAARQFVPVESYDAIPRGSAAAPGCVTTKLNGPALTGRTAPATASRRSSPPTPRAARGRRRRVVHRRSGQCRRADRLREVRPRAERDGNQPDLFPVRPGRGFVRIL